MEAVPGKCSSRFYLLKTILVLFLVTTLASACSLGPKNQRVVTGDFKKLTRNHRVAVLPVDVEDPGQGETARLFRHSLYANLKQSQLNLMEPYVVNSLLQKNGLDTIEQIRAVNPMRLGEILGADALVFTKLHKVRRAYLLIHSSIQMKASIEMVDTRTEQVIWSEEQSEFDFSGIGKIPTGMFAAAVSPVLFVTNKMNLHRLTSSMTGKLTQAVKFPKKMLKKKHAPQTTLAAYRPSADSKPPVQVAKVSHDGATAGKVIPLKTVASAPEAKPVVAQRPRSPRMDAELAQISEILSEPGTAGEYLPATTQRAPQVHANVRPQDFRVADSRVTPARESAPVVSRPRSRRMDAELRQIRRILSESNEPEEDLPVTAERAPAVPARVREVALRTVGPQEFLIEDSAGTTVSATATTVHAVLPNTRQPTRGVSARTMANEGEPMYPFLSVAPKAPARERLVMAQNVDPEFPKFEVKPRDLEIEPDLLNTDTNLATVLAERRPTESYQGAGQRGNRIVSVQSPAAQPRVVTPHTVMAEATPMPAPTLVTAPPKATVAVTPAVTPVAETLSRPAFESDPPPAVKAVPVSQPAETQPEGSPDQTWYTIQVGAYKTRTLALNLTKKLLDKGYKAFLSPHQKGDSYLYRVQVDRFPNRDEAVQFGQHLKAEESLPNFVTRWVYL